MNEHKKQTYVISVLVITFIFTMFGCNQNNPTEIINLVEESDTEFGEITIINSKHIEVENRIGSILLSGVPVANVVQYYIYKTIKAETNIKAKEHFEDISIQSVQIIDTTKCSIDAPGNTEYIEYSCLFGLDIPYGKPCTINRLNKGITTSQLSSSLYVKNSLGKIEVTKHTGSCDVKTSSGNVYIEMILPASGFCRSYTSSGEIKLEIPVNTSANINAKTSNGVISYSNLNIQNIIQSTGKLSGQIGSGNGIILLETEKGNIEIAGFN